MMATQSSFTRLMCVLVVSLWVSGYTVFVTSQNGLVNVAENKTCTLSSIFYFNNPQSEWQNKDNNTCSAANNGNTTTTHSLGNCIWTQWDRPQETWTVDLGQAYTIDRIVVFPWDKWIKWMTAVTVAVDGTIVYTFPDDPSLIQSPTHITTTTTGQPLPAGQVVTLRRLMVDKPAADDTAGFYMAFCEVQVLAKYNSQLLPFAWSADSLEENTTLTSCPGQNVSLLWNYEIHGSDMSVIDIQWRFAHSAGASETVLATKVMDSFLVTPSATFHLLHEPSAGLRLLNVSPSDSGTYTVHINVNVQGIIVTKTRTVHLSVSANKMTETGVLDVQLENKTVFLSSDNQYHVQLSCGTFTPLWRQHVDVVWKVSNSSQTLSSSSQRDGRFLLTLPNPVTSLEYTCTLDTTSAASECVQPGSALLTGASLVMDQQKTTIMVLQAENQRLKQLVANCPGK